MTRMTSPSSSPPMGTRGWWREAQSTASAPEVEGVEEETGKDRGKDQGEEEGWKEGKDQRPNREEEL